MITTNSKSKFLFMRKLRNHGIELNNKKSFPYTLNEIGFNFRLSDINCAIGLAQLRRLENFRLKKTELYNYFENKLKKIKNIGINKRSNFSSPLWHLLIIKLKSFNLSKKEIFMRYLLKNKIATQIHYIPIYKHKPFIKDICFSKKGADPRAVFSHL